MSAIEGTWVLNNSSCENPSKTHMEGLILGSKVTPVFIHLASQAIFRQTQFKIGSSSCWGTKGVRKGLPALPSKWTRDR